MTASARNARLLKTARQILEEAGRPLSVRRILRAGEQEGRFEGEPSLDDLRAALMAGIADGVVREARRGIFTLASGEPEAVQAEAEPAPAEAEAPAPASDEADAPAEPPKRRRRRREAAAEAPVETPATLEEAAELSSGSDRDALKSKLWSRLRRKASQVTDQPVAESEAPAPKAAEAPAAAPAEKPEAPAEKSADAETDEAPRGRRRRRRRESGESKPERGEGRRTAPADGEKPRRRRRRAEPAEADAPAAKPAASAAPNETAEGVDPRARLKARLARRGQEASAEPQTEASPAPKAEAATESAPATPQAGGGDARSLLKQRLAARAGAAAPAPAPQKAPAPSKEDGENEPAPRGRRRRRRGGDARADLKARLAARVSDQDTDAPAAPAESVTREERAPSSDGDARAKLKARLAARAGGSEARAKPQPVEAAPAAAPAAASATTGGDARSAFKARLAARAGGKAPAEVSVPQAAADSAPVAPTAPGGDPRSALKARLAARRGTSAPASRAAAPAPTAAAPETAAPETAAPETAAPETAAPPAAESADPRAALKSRLAARRGADPLEVPLSESRRPYREKRKAAVEPAAERRAPGLPEVSPTSTLISAALSALRSHGSPMGIDALAAAVDSTAEGGAGGLRAALRAENARRDASGLRPLFVAHYGGEVGLTEWGLSARYRALETQIQEALAEQRELVRRDLLARVGDLDDTGFEQVIVMLLEQLGHHGVKVVHRQAGTVALTVVRDADGGGTEKIAVVARKSWGPIKDGTVRRLRDTLTHFEADSGLVMTVGTFAGSARAEARQDGLTHVRLIDGAGLAGLLFEHGIGLSLHRPLMRHVDAAFFASLEA